MVNGIINVYKEKGYTSFDVVAKMRGIFHQKKIGHTGTLDPDAEGVLPVCLGKATKVCDLLTDKDKEYKAVLLLGQATDTQDVTGEVVSTASVDVTEEEVITAIQSFVGKQMQLPPMYSALKVNGQKLCDLARQGITVERKPREITVYSIEIQEISLPEVTILVHCSKGTYIRTLCHDIGEKLGCYGCMKSLLRTRVSCFELENAYKLSELENLVGKTQDFVISVDSIFDELPSVRTNEEAQKLVINGNRIPVEFVEIQDGRLEKLLSEHVKQQTNLSNDNKKDVQKNIPSFRVYDYTNVFVGIYNYIEDTKDFKPVKIFYE